MKPFSRQNYYEVLEIAPDELPLGIRRAYKKAFELYQEASLASYSFFSEEERREILACIEQAYVTLINPESRAAYDRSLVACGVLEEGGVYQDKAKKPVTIYDLQKTCVDSPPSARRAEARKASAAQDPEIRDILAQDALAGSDLRKLRMNMRVSLEEIAEQTNIRIDILHALEAGAYELLPPQVYLKGFLKSYARCLKLDEQDIVNAYLKNMGRH